MNVINDLESELGDEDVKMFYPDDTGLNFLIKMREDGKKIDECINAFKKQNCINKFKLCMYSDDWLKNIFQDNNELKKFEEKLNANIKDDNLHEPIYGLSTIKYMSDRLSHTKFKLHGYMLSRMEYERSLRETHRHYIDMTRDDKINSLKTLVFNDGVKIHSPDYWKICRSIKYNILGLSIAILLTIPVILNILSINGVIYDLGSPELMYISLSIMTLSIISLITRWWINRDELNHFYEILNERWEMSDLQDLNFLNSEIVFPYDDEDTNHTSSISSSNSIY
jgi:hypothetical protein